MKPIWRSRRALRCCVVLMGIVVFLGLGFVPLLRIMGSFLLIEDRLRPAGAIVVLGGQSPFREMEAARDSWARSSSPS